MDRLLEIVTVYERRDRMLCCRLKKALSVNGDCCGRVLLLVLMRKVEGERRVMLEGLAGGGLSYRLPQNQNCIAKREPT